MEQDCMTAVALIGELPMLTVFLTKNIHITIVIIKPAHTRMKRPSMFWKLILPQNWPIRDRFIRNMMTAMTRQQVTMENLMI